MERYCACCKTSQSDPEDDATASGSCPICGGQLSFAAHSRDLGVDGAIGMTFATGSNIGEPLQTPFDQRQFKGGEEEDTVVRAMTMPDDSNAPKSEHEEDNEQDAAPKERAPAPSSGIFPSFDFSVPSFVGSESSASGEPTADFDASTLPAHLKLPTFPQFELPAIPGEQSPAEDNAARDDTQKPAIEGAPPPLRAGPPPRRRAPQEQKATPAPQKMELPALTLPTLGADPKKKEVTLLASEAAAELAEVPARKRPTLAILIIVALIGAGVGAWLKRDDIVAAITATDKKPVVVETARDKAMAKFAAAQAAYEKSQLDEAAKSFEEALALLPRFPRAHRGLAIARAKQNRPADAVEHYRIYLSLEPSAPDAVAVRKIIEDYEKAKATAAEKEPDKGKRRGK